MPSAWSVPGREVRCLDDVLAFNVVIRWWMLWRLVAGPLAPAVLAGIELARFGVLTAAAGAYIVFAFSAVAVDSWLRWQHRLAQRRLATLRKR